MREIRFRAWDKKYKFMSPVMLMDYADCDMKEVILEDGLSQKHGAPVHEWRKNEEFVLMQYTGLKDKNGKEIYEGDILEIPKPGLSYEIMSVEWKRVGKDVGWMLCKERHGLYPVCWEIGHKKKSGLENNFDYRTAIIGNIYENPELLKTTKK